MKSFAISLFFAGVITAAAAAAAQTYRIDPANSRATIHVGKAGAFSFIAGHAHEVTGPVESGSVDVDLDAPQNSRVSLVIATRELKVSPAGEPEGDVPKVQDAMDSDKVLDVNRFPRITYDSTTVAVKSRSSKVLDLVVTGRLTIRDATQTVTTPVRVELGENAMTATGRFEVKQTAFGIKPVSVGGVVAVKDALEIAFSVTARK